MEINGYPNYLIYLSGKVWSKKTKRYLKHGYDGRGYYQVSLCKNGIAKSHHIHRLLAEHFIENPENKEQVDHLDRNRKNNKINNLRWVTRCENQQNKNIQCNNSLRIANISPHGYCGYIYRKQMNGNIHNKWFKTLEEAIEYKTNYEKNM